MISVFLAAILVGVYTNCVILGLILKKIARRNGEPTQSELLADKAFSQGVANVLSYMGKGRED